jgi:hypothetical protein
MAAPADAGHEFLNDHPGAGDRTPAILVVMGVFSGPSAYHLPSAQTPGDASSPTSSSVT